MFKEVMRTRHSIVSEVLRKKVLKQSETLFGVSDTFPAYKNTSFAKQK